MILNEINVPSFKDSTIVRKGVIDFDTNQSSILQLCEKCNKGYIVSIEELFKKLEDK